MKIIALINQKGGVGKSTIACNIAVEASLDNKKVLLIDADVQGSTMAFRALRENNDIEAIAITSSTIHDDIKDLKSFDLIIIDAGGRDSTVFRSAMMACDLMIIPVLPSQFDIWGVADTIEILKDAKTYRDIEAYFLLNQIISKTIISKEAKEALNEFANDVKILNTVLHARVAFKNSIGAGFGVSEYDQKGKAGNEIKALYKELLTYLETWE